MQIAPIKTRIMTPPKDDLAAVIREAVKEIPEKSVLVITSKVLSIDEGRCIPIAEAPEKDELVRQEADKYLPRDVVPEGWIMHTVKRDMLIPMAGIDESNADGHYILWPKDPYVSAKKWYDWVRKEYGVQDVGILIVDSHSIPLRRGTVGISLSHWGFHPLIDYRGTPDLFGRPYKVSLTDIPDGLAGAAVLCMGEGSETTPLALATDLPFVTFSEKPYEATTPYSSFQIPLEEDLYYPFFKFPPWQKGGGGEGGEE